MKRMLCTLLALALALTSLSLTAFADEAVPMYWLTSQTNSEVDDESEIVKKLESYVSEFNIDLKGWYCDSANYNDNLAVQISGGDIPDVLVVYSSSELASLVDQGVIAELPIELIREKAPNYAAAMDANDDGSYWTTMIYNGKNYGVAQPMSVYPMAMYYRQDWLDAVKMDVPTTLEDYEKLMYAFANEDPDGDGQKDTYGMAERAFANVFGAFGLRIVTGGATGFKVEEMQLGKDNVPFFPYIDARAKDALALLAKWYKDGVLDMEFITGENHGGYQWLSHSFMNGQIGTTSAQVTHYFNYSDDCSDSANWGTCMKEFKAINPDVDIAIGPGVLGVNGESGTEAWTTVGRFTCLTTRAMEDQRKVDAFFKFLDLYYTDPEYQLLANMGVDDWTYDMTDKGPVRLIDGTEVRRLGVMLTDFGSTTVYTANAKAIQDSFIKSVVGEGYYRFNAPAVSEFSNVISTLDALTEKAYIAIITGEQPIDYFDTYVKEFKAAGGEAAEKAVQEAYAALLDALK